ncbi:hypothetical protein ACQKGI_20550 [Peribacillus muralis]|uniref:hypothetical protein n=1 Tax=Peribacillus muralis TaxID=264697 RepID=UPI003820A370
MHKKNGVIFTPFQTIDTLNENRVCLYLFLTCTKGILLQAFFNSYSNAYLYIKAYKPSAFPLEVFFGENPVCVPTELVEITTPEYQPVKELLIVTDSP